MSLDARPVVLAVRRLTRQVNCCHDKIQDMRKPSGRVQGESPTSASVSRLREARHLMAKLSVPHVSVPEA